MTNIILIIRPPVTRTYIIPLIRDQDRTYYILVTIIFLSTSIFTYCYLLFTYLRYQNRLKYTVSYLSTYRTYIYFSYQDLYLNPLITYLSYFILLTISLSLPYTFYITGINSLYLHLLRSLLTLFFHLSFSLSGAVHLTLESSVLFLPFTLSSRYCLGFLLSFHPRARIVRSVLRLSLLTSPRLRPLSHSASSRFAFWPRS